MKVPAITTTDPSNTTEKKPRKGAAFIMAADRPLAKPQNPTTPVVPRVRTAAQRTPTPSTSLHPNSIARTPKSLFRKTRAGTVTSPDPGYHSLTPRAHIARPSSAASDRSFATTSYNGNSNRLSQERTNPSLFFAAPQQPPYAPTPYVPSTGPKFFHADGAPSVMDSNTGDQYHLGRRSRGTRPSSPQLNANPPALALTSSARNANHSPPASRPGSMVGFPASSSSRPSSVMANSRTPVFASTTATPQENRSVKFVYANGTEELLPPRKPISETGSAAPSPQLSSSPMFANSSASPSSTKITYPLSPLASPSGLCSPPQYFQRHSSSRRSSIDIKARRGRNVSISSLVGMPIAAREENGDADDEGQSSTGGSGSSVEEEGDEEIEEDIPPPMTAAERIKQMEERSANARRERKVMDLEISNASLLVINKTLEREMRRQTAELRRYKRLARSGKLSAVASISNLRSASPVAVSESDTASILDGESEWEVNNEDDEDTEIEKLSEEEDDDDDDESESANDEKHREADEKRLTLDLSKHQTLLDASTRMNASLKCCLLITDQLIKEGKKALEYKIRPSEVRLGGRILRDEEDYYESLEPIDGPKSDFSTTGETETEDEAGFHNSYIPPEELQPVRHSLV